MIPMRAFFLLILLSCACLKSNYYQDNSICKNIKIRDNKKFVIVIPTYNNQKWYKNNLNSVFSQSYQNFRAIIVDDCSTDKNYKCIKNHITQLGKNHQVTLIKNDTRKRALANHFKAIHLCKDDEIIVCLDGDDHFANDYVLEYLNEVYQDSSIWLTYSQFNNWPVNEIGWCEDYPLSCIKRNMFREFGFVAAQGRSYYAWLAKQVKLQDLLCYLKGHEGQFFPAAGDVALMFPMLEMARNNFKFIPKVLIQRNIANRLNDFKVNTDLQLDITSIIRKKKKYLYSEQPDSHISELNKTADLVIFSYDRPLQLYALLESIEKFVKNLKNIYVIYKSSSQDFQTAYQMVNKQFTSAKFIQENNQDPDNFMMLTLGTVVACPSEYIMCAVDDIIVTDSIDVAECIKLIEKSHAYGFYVRLGKNITHCYIENKKEQMPFNVSIENNVYAWQFKYGKYDWDYATSIDMTIFNKKQLLQELEHIKFNSPNTLEWELFKYFSQQKENFDKIGLCYGQSKIVNIPLNRVQKQFNNPCMNFVDKYELLKRFKAHQKIDISKFYRLSHNSPHMGIKPDFIPM